MTIYDMPNKITYQPCHKAIHILEQLHYYYQTNQQDKRYPPIFLSIEEGGEVLSHPLYQQQFEKFLQTYQIKDQNILFTSSFF